MKGVMPEKQIKIDRKNRGKFLVFRVLIARVLTNFINLFFNQLVSSYYIIVELYLILKIKNQKFSGTLPNFRGFLKFSGIDISGNTRPNLMIYI